MSTATDIRDQFLTLLDGLSAFSGSDAAVSHKVDFFEKPTRLAYLGSMTRERISMRPSQFERTWQIHVVIFDQVAEGSTAEPHLLGLGVTLEGDVEDALETGSFPDGVSVELLEQSHTIDPNDDKQGSVSQVWLADWSETVGT